MRLIETDSASNQDISSAYNAGTYTADAVRMIFCRLFVDQIAGNGDYTAYMTIQRAGSGSAYRVVPITTAAVASGVTAAVLTTIGVPVSNTDVVNAYVLGLAGDTTTPDIACEWWEDDAWAGSRVIEGSLTIDQWGRIILAEAAGKSSGGGTTTITFRNLADTANRISATVSATTGDRSAVTLDGS